MSGENTVEGRKLFRTSVFWQCFLSFEIALFPGNRQNQNFNLVEVLISTEKPIIIQLLGINYYRLCRLNSCAFSCLRASLLALINLFI